MKSIKNLLKGRNFVVFTLVMMLVLVGTINYNLSKRSLLETSNELKEYEKSMMEALGDELAIVEEDMEGEVGEGVTTEDIQIVDSNASEIEQRVAEANANITQELTSEENMEKATYFVDMKLSREKQRGELMEELDRIISNPSTSEKGREEALNYKLGLIKFRESEITIENLLATRGYENSIVYISENMANIVVNKEKLDQQDIAKISDIVMTQTGLTLDKIRIMNNKR
ncbi:stage III sporulation protein AH [Alkalithermobacter thermoalcaliphilus JW-YL-7 = DSM 7308]|uniref:Stage III sporulation protein n=1 Tax=Alkalithermobacter thermoalcaliphilus JW-YL-7 = DSM 7308 TaxID=1121328 RepID=A0A150FPU0_CLOPD|nr:Stage III sporulation protein [[Clostridium] paradoxum JW-YL-7 = DSM 7308]SHK94864.1 stage III sporulation protein AH [[Clostridium] paradoxum JW-YL-7 = DSM 7308]